jgi:hypothetical protein
MTMKRSFLLILLGIFVSGVASQAQVLNGSFADGFTSWSLLGNPTVDTSSPPSNATADAVISSTNSLTTSDSVSASTIESTLGVILPATNDGTEAPQNGEAIYQTITLTIPEVLTFEYETTAVDSLSTNDNVGYSLTNTALISGSTPDPGTFVALGKPQSPYATVTSDVIAPGTYILGFVAYNTNDEFGNTSFSVSDIEAPEPVAWTLMLAGVGCLAVLSGFMPRLLAPARR